MSVVAFSTLLSRLLGLVRDAQGAAFFGISILNSAFYTAFRTPNLFRRFLAEGSLTAAFIPMLHEELKEHGREGAFQLLSKVSSWLLVITAGLVGIGMIGFGFARVLFLNHNDKWYLEADLTTFLFPYLIFICLAASFSATLQAMGRFTEQSLSPIFLNLSMIIFLGIFGRFFSQTGLGQMYWLCAGVLFGGFLQAAIPGAVLVREGWRPKLDLTLSPRVREIAVLMIPGLFGSAIYQINIYFSGLLAFSLNDSAASVLFLANRVMEVPIGIFAIAVATVSFHSITKHANNRDYTAMGAAYLKGQRLILTINIPAAVGLVLLSEPIVRLLFQRGAFHASDTAEMVPILAAFAIGMPFFSAVSQMTRTFYAMKDMRTPVKAALASFVANIGLSFVLMHFFSTVGLALASNIAIIVQAVWLQSALGLKLPNLHFSTLVPTLLKIALASLGMGVAVFFGWDLVRALFGDRHMGDLIPFVGVVRFLAHIRISDLLAIFGLIPLAVAVYGSLLWALKVEGREDLEAIIAKRFRRKAESVK